MSPNWRPPARWTRSRKGTTDGLALLLNIVAMLLVLVALVHLANAILSVIPDIAGAPVTLQRVLGILMAPVCWLMGIPWSEAATAGSLMGIKTVLNEFIAYIELSKLPAGALSERSRLIMLYAMCGFANFASLGIMIAGSDRHGAAAPRGDRVARLEDHRVRHARDHGDRRDHRGAELAVFPASCSAHRSCDSSPRVFTLSLSGDTSLSSMLPRRLRASPSSDVVAVAFTAPLACRQIFLSAYDDA